MITNTLPTQHIDTRVISLYQHEAILRKGGVINPVFCVIGVLYDLLLEIEAFGGRKNGGLIVFVYDGDDVSLKGDIQIFNLPSKLGW